MLKLIIWRLLCQRERVKPLKTMNLGVNRRDAVCLHANEVPVRVFWLKPLNLASKTCSRQSNFSYNRHPRCKKLLYFYHVLWRLGCLCFASSQGARALMSMTTFALRADSRAIPCHRYEISRRSPMLNMISRKSYPACGNWFCVFTKIRRNLWFLLKSYDLSGCSIQFIRLSV